jgi:hypothetical protein
LLLFFLGQVEVSSESLDALVSRVLLAVGSELKKRQHAGLVVRDWHL